MAPGPQRARPASLAASVYMGRVRDAIGERASGTSMTATSNPATCARFVGGFVAAGGEGRGQLLPADVLHVRLAGRQPLDPVGVYFEADDVESRPRPPAWPPEAHVPLADDYQSLVGGTATTCLRRFCPKPADSSRGTLDGRPVRRPGGHPVGFGLWEVRLSCLGPLRHPHQPLDRCTAGYEPGRHHDGGRRPAVRPSAHRIRPGNGDGDQALDRGVLSLHHLLQGCPQFLCQLLARSAPHYLDLDVHTHLRTGQSDHPFRQIDDADWLAHLQHEDFAPLGEERRLENQLYRLFDAHKEPGHSGVGYLHRAATLDLTGEGRNHAPPASQDVAEPHGTVGGRRWSMGQEDLLGEPFGRAHHTRWPDRFVCGDQHKPTYSDRFCCFDHVETSQHVRPGRLYRVVFQYRYVLVRRGMQHDFGLVLFEGLEHSLPVRDVDQCLMDRPGDGGCRVVDVSLVMVKEHKDGGIKAGDLAADLRPDGTTCSSDEHPVTLERPAHAL